MTLPATIRAVVDPQAITRVTRLFNGTLADVLNELLQNARRAGATRVDIETLRHNARTTLIVRDDGRGIDDPAALLALGRSGWDETIARSEDPAGMGVFSLAGCDIEVRSRDVGAPQGWRVAIPADAWERGTPLAIQPCDTATGTEIRIAMPNDWPCDPTQAVRATALYYPLPVFLAGTACERQDFLLGAVAIEESLGCRIGVMLDRRENERPLNFHGIQAECRLPQVREIDESAWSVRIDVVDAPDLKLVLPARKEVVQDDAVTALRIAAERAIYRAIAGRPGHWLPFTMWQRAREMGVELPEADPVLIAWHPEAADNSHRWSLPTMVRDEPMLIVPPLEPGIAQAAAPVLRRPDFIAARPVRARPELAGYGWYDRLPRIGEPEVTIRLDGSEHRYDGGGDMPDGIASGPVDDLRLGFALASGNGATQEHRLPIDALVCEYTSYDLDDAVILIRRDADITPDRLAGQIEDTLFCADEDDDSDSWETQHDCFRRAARARAIALLEGEEAADLDRIRSAFHDAVRWLIPAGRTVAITAGAGALSVTWIPSPPAG